MRMLTLAAGLAAGYVLGTRAGRGKYEQIVANAQRVQANPTVGQAFTAVTDLFGSTKSSQPADAVVSTVDAVTSTVDAAEASTVPTTGKPARRRAAATPTTPTTPGIAPGSSDPAI